jgi:RAC serine/threonine-protein kinase
MIIREGWLLKRGEHIKNWRARYFVLMDDGSLLGFKQKPPPGQYKDPTNNFTVKRCNIFKVESPTHFIFVIKGLSYDQEVIERNFSAGNDHDRDSWCNAIMETALRFNNDATNNLSNDINLSHQITTSNTQLTSPSATTIPTIMGHKQASTMAINNQAPNILQPSTATNSTTGLPPFNFGLGGGVLELVQEPKKMCLEDFNLIKLIGRGSWGKVMLSREKSSGSLYAIKILKKHVIISQNEVGHTLTESRVLRTTNHPFLIALRYSFRDGERLCFVMEYAGGGELFYHLSQERKFSEEKTKFYGAEIVSALGYLHDHDIIYRDLKLENLLLGCDGHIKIADFGLCKDNIRYHDTTRTFCGTPEYLSPEVIEDNHYGRAVDWWSLGVLLYEMMCGSLPFDNRTTDLLFREILLRPVQFPANLSEPAKSFLNGLLIKDPAKRLGGGPDDAREIMMHSFFRGLNWLDLIEKKVPPPFIPEITSETDTRYFDCQFTTEPVNLTPIDRPMNHLGEVDASFFTQFSFAAGSQLGHR